MSGKAELNAVFARKIAHRGFHDSRSGVIENTSAAFSAALAGGYGMECDIQPSADGEAMVFHDFTLDRLTHTQGRVDRLNATDLKAVRFRQGSGAMQSLDDLLTQISGREPLVIELKSRFDGNTRIATRVAALVADYAGPLVLKSFDPAMIVALRDAGVKQPLGVVGMGIISYEYPDFGVLTAGQKHELANLLHFGQSRPDFLSWHHGDLASAVPYLCRTGIGMPLMSWTIRSQADADLARPHIDQIVFEGFSPA
ncbi:UgpQ Glycerophosphoryl diester phosphodiesterase [Rhabdaerophilaceae bacterium]